MFTDTVNIIDISQNSSLYHNGVYDNDLLYHDEEKCNQLKSEQWYYCDNEHGNYNIDNILNIVKNKYSDFGLKFSSLNIDKNNLNDCITISTSLEGAVPLCSLERKHPKLEIIDYTNLRDHVSTQVIDYEEIYYSYIENELIPKYGLTKVDSEIKYNELNGITSAYIIKNEKETPYLLIIRLEFNEYFITPVLMLFTQENEQVKLLHEERSIDYCNKINIKYSDNMIYISAEEMTKNFGMNGWSSWELSYEIKDNKINMVSNDIGQSNAPPVPVYDETVIDLMDLSIAEWTPLVDTDKFKITDFTNLRKYIQYSSYNNNQSTDKPVSSKDIYSWDEQMIENAINNYLSQNWNNEHQYYVFSNELLEDEDYWFAIIRWNGAISPNVDTGSNCKIYKATGEVEISFISDPPNEFFNIHDYATDNNNQSTNSRIGKITTERDPLNVRQSPSTESEKIGTVDKGSTITILSEVNGWYEIEYNGKSGYVSGEFVQIVE